jgi:phosphoribosylaminoimidazole carboxylase (NCAIR synthetase)
MNEKELLKKKGALSEAEVKDFLKSYKIKTTKYKVVKNKEDLKDLDLNFPVALKVCSGKI